MNHQYGLNQAGFPTSDFTRTCEILAAAGYDGVEPNYSIDGRLTTKEGQERVRHAATTNGLTIPSISTTAHWEYPLSSANDDRRNRGIKLTKRMVDAAVAVGADEILLVPAVIEPGANYNACYDRAVDAVREVLRYAAEQGVTVAIENVQNNFLYSPREFVEFLETVADAGPVSAYFDVGNGLREGLPDRWIRELNEWISKVHLKDWLIDGHRPTYPLQGDVAWQSVVTALSDIGYDGWLTAEIPPYQSNPERMPQDLIDTLQFLFETDRS